MVGDFNSRIHARKEGEEQTIGPHTFGRGREFLETHYVIETTNRDLLIEALQNNEATIANTFFKKDPSKKVTFQEPKTKNKEPPWTPERFAEPDFAIPNKSSRNTRETVESDTITYFPSDHFPLTILVKHKIKKVEDIEPNLANVWKGVQAPERQLKKYNAEEK